MSESQVSVPLPVRLRFGHAAVQHLAEQVGVDLLHIKGAAVDPSLRPGNYAGSDVDVLVRPEHVPALDRAMRQHGWRLYSTFEYGSPFGHAQTYIHDAWGFIDLHRYFPGIRLEPERAFDVFWSDRHEIEIAAVGCLVPGVTAQAVLLLLNAARAPRQARPDVSAVWSSASDEQRREIEGLVGRLHAEVAFAAATGTLDRYVDARDYRLWKVASEGGSRSEEWWARIRAAPSVWTGLRVAARAPLVNIDHLAHRLGRTPRRRDIVLEFIRRPLRAIREAARAIGRKTVRR